MKIYAIVCASLLLLWMQSVNAQRVHYVNRFRNFSIESETGDVHLVNVTIIQERLDHVLTGSINITRDIRLKNAIVVIHRCKFENSACENFQKWKFSDKELKTVIYMKNQIWTPLFDNLSPRLDPPLIKKNVHHTKKATLDTKAALVFYPEASKYFWRAEGEIFDIKEKKVCTLLIETAFFTFVDRGRKRERGGSTSKPDDV